MERDVPVLVSLDLLNSLVDVEDCDFDHHGGCQAHGYLGIRPGETCPQRALKDLVARGDGPPDPTDLLEEWFVWWRDSDEAPPKLPRALHVRTGLALLLYGRIEADFHTLP